MCCAIKEHTIIANNNMIFEWKHFQASALKQTLRWMVGGQLASFYAVIILFADRPDPVMTIRPNGAAIGHVRISDQGCVFRIIFQTL